MKKLLVIDRDGTLVRAMPRGEYLLRLDQLQLLPGALELVREAKRLGYAVVVVTNQPQVAKGLLSLNDLQAIHQQMIVRFEGLIDKIYFCPHRGEDGCACRKPQPGMLLQALQEFEADPKMTLMIGDTDKDILAGQTVGCRTIFIRDDQNAAELAVCNPHHIVDRLGDIFPLL